MPILFEQDVQIRLVRLHSTDKQTLAVEIHPRTLGQTFFIHHKSIRQFCQHEKV